MNPENLRPGSERSQSEARENGRKGGKASGVTRRKHKAFKDLLKVALAQKSPLSDASNEEEIVLAMIRKALDGDVPAFTSIRDTMGEKPKDKVESKMDAKVVYKWEE